MAIPAHLAKALDRRVAKGDYDGAAKLARELHVGAQTPMDRRVLEDWGRRHNIKVS